MFNHFILLQKWEYFLHKFFYFIFFKIYKKCYIHIYDAWHSFTPGTQLNLFSRVTTQRLSVIDFAVTTSATLRSHTKKISHQLKVSGTLLVLLASDPTTVKQ